MSDLKLNFEKGAGLIPAIVQDSETGEVLMQAFQNLEAYQKTLKTGTVWFWSRSRQELWQKGATSGNVLKVVEIFTDCDTDAVLIKVAHDDNLKACHTGERSCFHQKIQ